MTEQFPDEPMDMVIDHLDAFQVETAQMTAATESKLKKRRKTAEEKRSTPTLAITPELRSPIPQDDYNYETLDSILGLETSIKKYEPSLSPSGDIEPSLSYSRHSYEVEDEQDYIDGASDELSDE
jgi:hypothetical protein